MVDVSIYVEFKAKTLIRELSENFDIRKCGDLYQTLGDLAARSPILLRM